ncbi:MAG: glutaminyl-peptide cyclotransferase, partial [Ornithinimicrobium sp.]|uniref:glutaminyl-peptide cyclotransferase n=1 Tax=Ornithinimicrobium sp. TaxID=1977084 RepID=UPI003D9B0793
MPSHRLRLLVSAGVLAALAGCGGSQSGQGPARASDATSAEAVSPTSTAGRERGVEVVEVLDRGPGFTQGLELLDDGRLLHSTGRYGESSLQVLLLGGPAEVSTDLPAEEFGEGATLVGDTAYQLTWKSGVVHTWSLPDLVEGPSLQIEGDGWGLCYDETRDALWQSDGTSTLRLLAVPDLAPIAEVNVTEQIGDRATPVQRLNELECDQGRVWANVWQSEDILLIEPPRGDAAANKDTNAQVLQRVSLSRLVEGEGHSDPDNVLNGVALEEQD